jgi:hypothetical protein
MPIGPSHDGAKQMDKYFELEETKRLLALCRNEVIKARISLAIEPGVAPQHRSRLWKLIDSREWFIRMLAEDFNDQLEQIDRALETDLFYAKKRAIQEGSARNPGRPT